VLPVVELVDEDEESMDAAAAVETETVDITPIVATGTRSEVDAIGGAVASGTSLVEDTDSVAEHEVDTSLELTTTPWFCLSAGVAIGWLVVSLVLSVTTGIVGG